MSLADLQAVIAIFVPLVTGFWIWFKFKTLHVEEKARDEEAQRKRDLYAEATVEVGLSCERLGGMPEGIFVIAIAVEMKNKGNRKTHLEYRKTRCSVARMTFDSDWKIVLGKPVAAVAPIDGQDFGTYLPVGYVHRMQCFAKVDGPGLYVVRFDNELSDEEMRIRRESGLMIPEGTKLFWEGKVVANIQ